MPGHFDDLSGHAMYNLSCCLWTFHSRLPETATLQALRWLLQHLWGASWQQWGQYLVRKRKLFQASIFVSALTYIIKIIFPVTLSDIIIKPIVILDKYTRLARQQAKKLRFEYTCVRFVPRIHPVHNTPRYSFWNSYFLKTASITMTF